MLDSMLLTFVKHLEENDGVGDFGLSEIVSPTVMGKHVLIFCHLAKPSVL